MADTITIDIPSDFQHHAAIYKPRPIHAPASIHYLSVGAPAPDVTPRYGIILPESDVFAGCRRNNRGGINASSAKPPLIMIGNDTNDDHHAWQRLCERAAQWRIPLDVLLTNRPLKVACGLWTPRGPYATGHQAVQLIGVQILGDLTKSPLLDERIAEAKAWFSEGDE